MKDSQSFSIKKRIKSFRFAINGLKFLIVNEHNARIHLFATILVIILGIFFEISGMEWMAVLICIGLVLSLEAVNSSIEVLSDEVTQERNEAIKVIKDLSAAAVLISAIISAVVGLIIFLPKICS